MSRCEPAPEYRGKDGWHWVQAPVGSPHLARWDASENPSVEALWTSSHHVYSGTPRYVVNEWGWRYLEPVATPDEVAALRGDRDAERRGAAIANQHLSDQVGLRWKAEAESTRLRKALEEAIQFLDELGHVHACPAARAILALKEKTP